MNHGELSAVVSVSSTETLCHTYALPIPFHQWKKKSDQIKNFTVYVYMYEGTHIYEESEHEV